MHQDKSPVMSDDREKAMETGIRLVEYNPDWPQQFEQGRSCIFVACEGLVTAVEHIGSTAVPGLPARPVIDMIGIVRQAGDLDETLALLKGIGYIDLQRRDDAVSSYQLLCTPRYDSVQYRLYLTLEDSPQWKRQLTIRDWLRRHPQGAQRYVMLKQHLAQRYGDNSRSYEQAKTLFLLHLEEQAEAELGRDE